VPHLNKSLARFNKTPFYQGFLTGIVTLNLREFFIEIKDKVELLVHYTLYYDVNFCRWLLYIPFKL